jgi:hypothetical protein
MSLIVDKFLTYIYTRNTKCHHIYEYTQDAVLIEAGHIPYMAFRLLSGKVIVFNKEEKIAEYGPHTCWGPSEIMNGETSLFTVCIIKGSTVCAIGKSELQKTWMKFLNLFDRDMLEAIEEEIHLKKIPDSL